MSSITPGTYEEFLSLAAQGTVVPLVKTVMADLLTPAPAALGLDGLEEEFAAFPGYWDHLRGSRPDLGHLEEAAALAARLARRFELPRHGTRSELDGVVEHLRERELLLVLDNFETLGANATPLVEQLLAQAPRLKVIVTTRERLALAAQWALPLDGLPCPEPEDEDRFDDFDATRLFIAAAREILSVRTPPLVILIPRAPERFDAVARMLAAKGVLFDRRSTRFIRSTWLFVRTRAPTGPRRNAIIFPNFSAASISRAFANSGTAA